MSDVGKDWMGLVARVPCVVCVSQGLGDTPAVVHHAKFSTGLTNKSDDVLVLALCPFHHTGAGGIHQLKNKGFYARYKKDELDFMADTIRAVLTLLRDAGRRLV